MKTVLYAMLGTILGSALVIGLLSIMWMTDTYRYIPICPEDSVLVGTIDFDRRRWDTYICGPAYDDYKP